MARSEVILLKKNGTAIRLKSKGKVADHGLDWYHIDPQRTYLMDTMTGPKKLLVFVEGDPEAVGHREPIGLDAGSIKMLAGPVLPRLIVEALNPPTNQANLKFWVIGAIAIGGLFAGWFLGGAF